MPGRALFLQPYKMRETRAMYQVALVSSSLTPRYEFYISNITKVNYSSIFFLHIYISLTSQKLMTDQPNQGEGHSKLEIVFVNHYVSNHVLASKDNTRYKWRNLQRSIFPEIFSECIQKLISSSSHYCQSIYQVMTL